MTLPIDTPALNGFVRFNASQVVAKCGNVLGKQKNSSVGRQASQPTKSVEYVATLLPSFETLRGRAYK